MNAKPFIDTNIWVYAHLQDVNNNKCNIALALLEALPILVSSTQVLNEYYSVMLKNKVADCLIQDNAEIIIAIADMQLIRIATIRLAHEIKLKYGFSYWDSLIVASALEAECQCLYSEDMQHKQLIESSLIIINPFKN
ncbi:MAG: PIN domain-containing protein [Methylococcaceae bacterium]